MRQKSANRAANSGSEKKKNKLSQMPGKFTAKGLTEENLDEIIAKYGVDIEDIYNLSPGQEWMFARAKKVTSAFFLQTYIKINMEMKPSAFRQKLDEVSLKRTNLRTAFAYRGLEKPYQVVLKNRRPELAFIDRSDKTLEELEEEIENFRISDRKRGFDLEKDPLLRMTVFKTSQKDTYAIVMSQPHINDDGVSEGIIIKEVFIDYALKGKVPMPEMPSGSYKSYAKWIEGLDREEELKYWEKLLSGCKSTLIPGRIDSSLEPVMNTLTLDFSLDDGRAISSLQSRYHATMNSIVQSAWGVMLQNIYGTKDAVFGSITSGRSPQVSANDTITGSFVNAFPVRVKADSGMLFKELVIEVQNQIMASQSKAHCTPDEIGERLGKGGPVFDHLLNFHNFGGGNRANAPKLPGFSILDVDFFDNLSTGFCLYFKVEGKSLKCQFTYDMRSFTEKKILILMQCYKQVMDQILGDEDASLKISDIKSDGIGTFISTDKDREEEIERLSSFVKNVSIFKGIDDEALGEIAKEAEVMSYAEGDIIIKEKSFIDGIYIVMEGYVEEYRTGASGWVSTLKSLGPGKAAGFCGILDGERTYFGISAISESVKIIHISKENMLAVMENYPAIFLNLIREENRTSRNYSMLWVNSDY